MTPDDFSFPGQPYEPDEPRMTNNQDGWMSRALKLEQALRGLIDRLDYVHDDPAYKSVWAINQMHCGPYSGPTYTVDLEKARHTLEMHR